MMKNKASLIFFLVVLILVGCSSQNNQSFSSQASPPASNPVGITPTLLDGRENIGSIPGASVPTATPLSANPGPKISFTSDYADRGQVPVNTEIKQIYEFKNTGSDVLELTTIPTVQALEGCWPPAVLVGSTRVQPGETSFVSFVTSMHEGMDGPHTFEVTVRSNDPIEPEKKLIFKASWVPPTAVSGATPKPTVRVTP